eukprot:2063737-Pyramimonas_sp.AAC.1
MAGISVVTTQVVSGHACASRAQRTKCVVSSSVGGIARPSPKNLRSNAQLADHWCPTGVGAHKGWARSSRLTCEGRSSSRKMPACEQVGRSVAAAIPLRCCPDQSEVQVMLVNSSRGPGYVFPKGRVEKRDACPEQTAMREALEEAGVVGEVLESFCYSAQYTSRKAKKKGLNSKGLCNAQCFIMAVTEELDTWPEMNSRHRHWYPLEEAKERCKHSWMHDALCELEGNLEELVPALSTSSHSTWTSGITVEVRKEPSVDGSGPTSVYHFG